MKKLVYLAFIVGLFSCSPRLKPEATSKIQWRPDRPLTWDDYTGSPSLIKQSNVAATTSCRFGILINPETGEVTVTNEFITYQSSVRPNEKKPSLLAHEQRHFDLCEVYARKLRKELKASQLSRAQVKEAFLRTYSQYKQRQLLYDEQTRHGLNDAAQQQWESTIAQELENNR
jgi:hypothetical protein